MIEINFVFGTQQFTDRFEWDIACVDNSPGAKCKLRSGSWFYNDSAGYNRCSGVYTSDSVRNARYDDTGFRCCAP